MAAVFAHADRLFTLLHRLVRRPAEGELPHDVRDRFAELNPRDWPRRWRQALTELAEMTVEPARASLAAPTHP